MLMFDKSSVSLNKGFTINDYIIKANENRTAYWKICRQLQLTMPEATAIYDRVYNIPIEAIGKLKKYKGESK